MATSNIKLFDENKVNMMPDEAYQVETQRTNGVQSGIASSQLQNKTLYQVSLVSYAIAQIMNQNGLNANDSDAVSTFVNNLSSTMLQKVQDIATTAEAQAGAATGKWMSPSLVKAAIDVLAAKSQNILSDATKTLYGLGTNAVPNDVFAFLGKYNQYHWKRRSYVITWEKVLSAANQDIYFSNNYNDPNTVYYSTEVDFTSDGTPVLKNPQSISVPRGTGSNALTVLQNAGLGGKYVTNIVYGNGTTVPASDVYLLSSNPTFQFNSGGNPYTGKANAQWVTSKKVITIGEWELIRSSDRNAYPDSGVVNNYEYAYFGIPFQNAVTAPEYATGSYIGTGTFGESNPNSLTFDFVPKLLIVQMHGSRQGLPWLNGQASGYVVTNNASNILGGSTMNLLWNGNTVSWYSTSENGQLNTSNKEFYYIAIG